VIERLADPSGQVIGLAIDHRDSLRTAAARRGMPTDPVTLAGFKADVVAALGADASVVLVDEELGGAAIARLPKDTALVMPLEEQGYETVGDGRVTTLLAEFPPARARERGAVACKLLLPYHPDRTEAARLQESVARQAIEACRGAGLGLVLEPIVYEATGAAFALSVIETARRLALLGPDVLKLQFPAGSPDDGAACRAVTDVSGDVPWVLLGGGAGAGTFVAQLETAMRAGARGFIAGRTVWDPALVADPRERERALREISGPLLREAARVARTAALGTSQARRDV
jgi:tagatose 1,6-diphosphate aldolase